MPVWYNFYTDESNIHNRPEFWIGGLKLTPAREVRFRKSCIDFLESRNISHEIKWNKVNGTYFSLYKGIIDLFISESAPQFKALKVVKGPNWKSFGANEEVRFFKSCYVYFRLYARESCRHDLVLDDKTSKWYRWQSLSYALNGKVGQNYSNGRHIRSIERKDSKSDILLQITDILLGALSYNGRMDSPKGKLAKYVWGFIAKSTKYGSDYFFVREFTPEIPKK